MCLCNCIVSYILLSVCFRYKAKMGPSYDSMFMGHTEHQVCQSYRGSFSEMSGRCVDDDVEVTPLSLDELSPNINSLVT